jgi:hypothetical protein
MPEERMDSECPEKLSCDEILSDIVNIINRQNGSIVDKSRQAFRNFHESWIRLYQCSCELMTSEAALCKSDHDNRLESDRLQMDFLSKTETFHQKIYSTISFFIKLLSCIAPPEFKNNMPSKSVERFLTYIKTSIPNLSLSHLERSRSIRTLYIDHPQMSQSFNWDTFSFGDVGYVIFFEPDKNGQLFDLSPFLECGIPNYKVPSPYYHPRKGNNFFVSPNHSPVYIELCELIGQTIKRLSI